MRYWIEEYWVPTLIIALLVAFVAVTIWAANEDEKQWQAFKREHGCRVVGRVSGSTVPGVGVSGSGRAVVTTSYIPSKTGWLCDDGVTYWR